MASLNATLALYPIFIYPDRSYRVSASAKTTVRLHTTLELVPVNGFPIHLYKACYEIRAQIIIINLNRC